MTTRLLLDGEDEYRLFDSVTSGYIAGYITQDVHSILRKCSDMRATIAQLKDEAERLKAERDGYRNQISISIAEHDLARKERKRRKETAQAAMLMAVFAAANLIATIAAILIMRGR